MNRLLWLMEYHPERYEDVRRAAIQAVTNTAIHLAMEVEHWDDLGAFSDAQHLLARARTDLFAMNSVGL